MEPQPRAVTSGPSLPSRRVGSLGTISSNLRQIEFRYIRLIQLKQRGKYASSLVESRRDKDWTPVWQEKKTKERRGMYILLYSVP